MRIKVIKKDNRCWFLIPDEIARNVDENRQYSISALKNQMFLIFSEKEIANMIKPQETKKPAIILNKEVKKLTDEELSLVNKLAKIRFEKRIVPYVNSKLNLYEQKILSMLIAKRKINIFRNKKYPKGVYNIVKSAYYAKVPNSKNAQQITIKNKPANIAINTIEHLQKMGYVILANEYEAKKMMAKIKHEIKDDVKGIRGFDKRYYVVKKTFLLEYQKPIYALLDDGITTPEKMAEQLKLTPDAVNVMLKVMAEEGEIIEKRKGVFARA